MLFSSFPFLFVFLPLTLLLFHLCMAKEKVSWAQRILMAASLFFYAWWKPPYLVLILLSICFNFSMGRIISRSRSPVPLYVGIGGNLALLGYFKYANFFVDNAAALFGTEWALGEIILPLAISFFTFQQIAYLADTHRDKDAPYSFEQYILFVTFFAQLIAGPIVHHAEMMPQFSRAFQHPERCRDNVARGMGIFIVGLFKKVVLADGIARYGNPVFDAAAAGADLTFYDTWGGALCYTFQLYFDFSGYSDMAIGLGLLVGITLPVNFNSPYRATNITEFWRRWHITLSRFLRDYLYIPLGGNRKGKRRRSINLFLTMLLGGMWHGAAWTFILWGGLHGIYLMVHQLWTRWMPPGDASHPIRNVLGWAVTFVAVVIGWVLFRATSFSVAHDMLASMCMLEGWNVPLSAGWILKLDARAFLWIAALGVIAFLLPNTSQLFSPHARTGSRLRFQQNIWSSMVLAGLLLWSLLCLNSSQVTEFLYFDF